MARALGTLPRLAQALAAGKLSYAKVRALTRVATPETEERLLAVSKAGTADHVERIVRGWRCVDRQAEARETGRLAPEVGAVLVHALTAAREALYRRAHAANSITDPINKNVSAGTFPADVRAETPTMDQQQADALGLVTETALHHGIDPGAPGERYQVVVHVDAPVLADPDAPGQSVLERATRAAW